MLIETEITNLSIYNTGMKKSLLDKVFFMDKVDSQVFIDYGCADGTLINFLRKLFPEFEYYGFDISETMIEEAKKKNPEIANNFFTDWNSILDMMPSMRDKNPSIILSSIIHEVYSYGTSSDVNTFWDRVFLDGFSYIIVRDMMPSLTIDRRSDINDIAKIYRKANRKQLYDFQQAWGSIENNKNLIHYFLKYRYIDNWDREVKENYMPTNREEFLSNIPDNYEIIFHEHFILPYLKTIVKKDFNVELKDNTHIKLILKRN